MATQSISPAPQKPSVVESGFGRFFYAANSVIYFSPLVRSIADIGRCYQVNDPTSDQISDVLATDGGELNIDEAGGIVKLLKFRYGILIFAENGVWYLSGPDGIFSATSFSLSKVSSMGCLYPDSVVLAESAVFYFSEEGIIRLSENEFNVITDEDITLTTIRSHYIEFFNGVDVVGNFKPTTKEVWWWQKQLQSDQPPMRVGGTSTPRGLVLDLKVGGFYPQQVDSFKKISKAVTKNSEYYHVDWSTSQTDVSEVTITPNLRDNTDPSFSDGTNPPYIAYLETGPETLGKYANGKSVMEASFFFNRTETQITDYNWDTGVYTYDKPSGCFLQLRWDFDDSNSGNRWVGSTPLWPIGPSFRELQIYNPNVRGFIPDTIPSDFSDGYSTVSQRQRLRGSGRAVKFRFESEDSKDMQMLGYAVAYSVKGRM